MVSDYVPEDYVPQEIIEYCIELCYHEHLCDFDPDCVDYDCYQECVNSFY